jgi:energy-coupling factor transport system substrate-specific component
MLSGWLFGKKKGFIAGASSLYLSNFFVFGGQGPWTLFQALAFGIAGFSGGFLRKKAKIFECIMVTLVVSLIFEIIMNISSLIFIPATIFTAFFLGIPFLIIHLISNGVFASLLPKVKNYIEQEGHFNEKEIYLEMINKFKGMIHEK